jgi:hypothetical protein
MEISMVTGMADSSGRGNEYICPSKDFATMVVLNRKTFESDMLALN